jgi:threonine dehydratase
MSLHTIAPQSIANASARIAPYIHRTPVLHSSLLNRLLGHEVVFKAECLQKTGAFKVRGALNTLLTLKEQGNLPQRVVAFSSGNHAQAVAWAAAQLGVKATIFLPGFVSSIKQQATESYGATVINTVDRKEAEQRCAEAAAQGAYFIHPFDNDLVITGQGTACYEALQEEGVQPDAVFAPCGGGGIMSGTFLATRLLKPDAKIFAGEPLQANDAAQSYRAGHIIGFDTSPPTIADGVRTPSITPRTYHYLKQLDGFFDISEEDIICWTQRLSHLLKISCEPTSAVAMAAAAEWLATQSTPQQALVIISGGNIAPETNRKIWEKDYLTPLETIALEHKAIPHGVRA